MPDHTATTGDASPPVTVATTHSRFFVLMAGAFLLIVLFGFTPSLYFRPYFDVPAIPEYLLLHGAVLTAWFIWFFVQTSLVAADRRDLHRRTGIIGVGIGGLVILAGAMATIGFVPRVMGFYDDLEAAVPRMAAVVWSNLAMAVTFAVLLYFAVRNRRKAAYHKRLMLLASISILGPALGRFGRYPFLQFSESRMTNEASYGLGGILMLVLTLVVYDFVKDRRLHRVTMIGGPVVMVTPGLFALGVGNTAFGQALVWFIIGLNQN